MAGSVPTEAIRNVVMLGHTGTGKSSLIEAMMQMAGIATAHGEGAPTLDHEPEERDRGSSLSLSLASIPYRDHKLNLIDVPGGAEVIGDAYPALLAADVAVFVIDAVVGIQPQHEELWRACEQRGIPRVVFMNKLELERARYQDCLDDLRERYGTPLAPLAIPLHLHPELDGLIDVFRMESIKLVGDERVRGPVPEDRLAPTEKNHRALVEAIVENDDELLMRYLDGDQPSTDELSPLFAHGVAECGFFPVICGSVAKRIGVKLLMDFLVEEGPSPAEAPHDLPHDGPITAYVLKTFSDQYVGRINLVRILSGSLSADDELIDVRTGDKHRLHQLFTMRGKEQLPVTGAASGDIVGVAKLDDVITGDVLTLDGAPVELDIPRAPDGFHRVVLHAPSVADDDKLAGALPRILAEDPSIRPVEDDRHGGRLLAFQGPNHVDITLARLKRKYGVTVEVRDAPIDYWETVRTTAAGLGRHVKQSGGHGQFGVAHIEMRPQPRGEGFEFEDRIVGGVIPNQLIPSVEKGVREAMKAGPLGGFPVVDVAVTLVDGKHHSVDSSDAAFQMAGILAFRDAAAKAQPVLLEPIVRVELTVPDELTGNVMSDLSSRRGRILGTDMAGEGRTRVDANVPEAELGTFAAEFRALTSGRGEVAMSYDHHEEVPGQIATKVLAELASDD